MVLILNEQSTWLYPSILTDSLKMGYPFQIACVQQPPPLRKNRRRDVCGGDSDCAQASLRRIIHFSSSSVKTANNNISVSSIFNDSEGLYSTTVCRCLVRRPRSLFRAANTFRVIVHQLGRLYGSLKGTNKTCII